MVKLLYLYLHMKKYKNAFIKSVLFIFLVGLCVACQCDKASSLVILHTNDTHSQIEPIERGKRDGNCAGYARRMGLIKQYRDNNPDIILLDAGDFSQGTPYFNFYHGRVEVDAFNRMGYDAVALGNHEFDYGVDTLAAVLKYAQFDVLCANYDVKGTPLEGIVKPYTILRKGGYRVGVFGLGVDPKGLIADRNFAPVKYMNPIPVAQEVASLLKQKHRCDVVICISHMGTFESEKQMSDTQLAKSTNNIDVIIGAHTHKIVTNHYVQNMDGDSVFLSQMGKSGARLGKITLKMHK